jgi:chaperonin GroEL
MAKQMAFDIEARDRLRAGVDKIARAVSSTLGPKGRNAILDKSWGGPTITKDGVTVADEIELEDPYENMAVQLIREAATRTSKDAGDGTTTATVLAKGLSDEGMKLLAAGAHGDGMLRGLKKAVDVAVDDLHKRARKINVKNRKELEQIATISANGDTTIGKTLADALNRVGADGVITVEEGKSLETTVTVVEGMQFDRGFLSSHFVTNVDKLEGELDNPLILLHQDKIGSAKVLVPLLEKVSASGRPLLIIAEDVEGEALATLVVNKLRGILSVCAVKAPGYGDRRKAMLQDIAIMTGATLVAPDLDLTLEKIEVRHLGSARKIVITAENTTFVQGAGKASDVSARVKQIRHEIEGSKSDYDKEKLQERLARLTGGIAEIRVGAATETELKERKARFEDAAHSSRAALTEGILPGGGVALVRARAAVEKLHKQLEGDEALGAQVVLKALELPMRVIARNAGFEPGLVVKKVGSAKVDTGFNAATGEYVDMYEAGIIDPLKVVRCALQNAASVAVMLLSTDCLVANLPEKEEDAHAGHAHGMGGMGGMGGIGGMGGMGCMGF